MTRDELAESYLTKAAKRRRVLEVLLKPRNGSRPLRRDL